MGILRSLSSSSGPLGVGGHGNGGRGGGGGVLFGRTRRGPRRHHSFGAERRPSEMNIMGNDGVVSAEYTLKTIQQAQSNPRLTKLELEDVIVRHDNKAQEIHDAIQSLLSKDRPWKYIKFIDQIIVRDGRDAGPQLQAYVNHRRVLWDTISNNSSNGGEGGCGVLKDKPIMFQVKLEVASGTSMRVVEAMLNVLENLECITSMEFGGGLYAVRKPDIPAVLVDLCRGDGEGSTGFSSRDEFALSEMIMLSISCTTPSSNAAPVNNAANLMRVCKSKLESLRYNSKEDQSEQDKSHLRSSDPSTKDASVSKRKPRIPNNKHPHHHKKPVMRDESITVNDLEMDASLKKQRLNDDEDCASSTAEMSSSSRSAHRRRSPRRPGGPVRPTRRPQRRHNSLHSGQIPSGSGSKNPDFDWSRRRHSHSPSAQERDRGMSQSSPAISSSSRRRRSSNKSQHQAAGKKPDYRWDKSGNKNSSNNSNSKLHHSSPDGMDASAAERRRSSTKAAFRRNATVS